MISIKNKQSCSGCHACYSACPVNCISMKQDEEGFLYPSIDDTKCIGCGKCEKACPVLYDYKGHPKGVAYACINKNDTVRLKSSSGGVFTLIAEYIINKGGAVFGAAFSDDFREVKHICVDNKEGLEKLRGAKYLQSIIGDTYKQAKEQLENGRPVLFTGTPCQISGLYTYLDKRYDNLYTQDIVCHGVPSSMVWQKYLEFRCEQSSSKIADTPPKFRDKCSGWSSYSVSMKFKNGDSYCAKASNDIYMKVFLRDICLRPSCYSCHSKSLERESDLTLADLWGVDYIAPEMNDNKGTSFVFVNTQKGENLFSAIENSIRYQPIDIDAAAVYNPSAFKSSSRPSDRESFLKYIKSDSFDDVVKRYIKDGSLKKFLKFIEGKLYRVYRSSIKKSRS